jgi:hypothetical protein
VWAKSAPIETLRRHAAASTTRSARLLRGQFQISRKGITRTPTGATYTPHSGTTHLAQLGNLLANGDDYRPHAVETMMEQLWGEYVAANPRLFEVFD